MASMAKEESSVNRTAREAQSSPLETAKQIAMTLCRQQKEAHWLGVRMENFYRAHQRKMGSVTAADACDALGAPAWISHGFLIEEAPRRTLTRRASEAKG